NATAQPGIRPRSLHDALPISGSIRSVRILAVIVAAGARGSLNATRGTPAGNLNDQLERRGWRFSSTIAAPGTISAGRMPTAEPRSEEHTSELQSRENLVCRLL